MLYLVSYTVLCASTFIVIVAFLIKYLNFIVCNNFSLSLARHIVHFSILYRKECR